MSAVSPSAPSGKDPLRNTLWPAVAVLLGVLLLAEFTPLDLWVQDACFDFATGQWRVDENASLPKALFYTGPKAVLIAFGLACIALLLGPAGWRRRLGLAHRRRELAAVIVCLGLGPYLTGVAKANTNMFCPYELTRYGGDVPYVKLFERFPEDARPERRGVCFPAGHASGGFALLALSGLAATRRGRLLGIAIGLAVGPWMGIYQMLKGAHYLRHTLITLVLMWLLFLACRAALARAWRSGPDSP